MASLVKKLLRNLIRGLCTAYEMTKTTRVINMALICYDCGHSRYQHLGDGACTASGCSCGRLNAPVRTDGPEVGGGAAHRQS